MPAYDLPSILVVATPVVPDILVCGNCHQNFSDIEIMINHKRRPCQPKVRCRCKGMY